MKKTDLLNRKIPSFQTACLQFFILISFIEFSKRLKCCLEKGNF